MYDAKIVQMFLPIVLYRFKHVIVTAVCTACGNATKKQRLYKQRKERDSEKQCLKGRIKRCEEAIEEFEKKAATVNAVLTLPETAADYGENYIYLK